MALRYRTRVRFVRRVRALTLSAGPGFTRYFCIGMGFWRVKVVGNARYAWGDWGQGAVDSRGFFSVCMEGFDEGCENWCGGGGGRCRD